jgi:hypothetical protein
MTILKRILAARADVHAALISTGIALQLLGVMDLTETQLLGAAGAVAAWLVVGQRIVLIEDLDALAGAVDTEVNRALRRGGR